MFSRKGEQTGRRFVTEATLIYSSRRSLKSSGSYDRLNVSRDVTFPQNLERLLRALILSCLIVCWRSYDKQTRVVVGVLGGGSFGRGAADGNLLCCLVCFATGSRCFCKLPLCLLQRGSKWKSELRSGVLLQTSRIAGLLHWIWLIRGKLFHPNLSLVHLLAQKMHIHPQTDIEQMLQACRVAHHCAIVAQLDNAGTFNTMCSLEVKDTCCEQLEKTLNTINNA